MNVVSFEKSSLHQNHFSETFQRGIEIGSLNWRFECLAGGGDKIALRVQGW